MTKAEKYLVEQVRAKKPLIVKNDTDEYLLKFAMKNDYPDFKPRDLLFAYEAGMREAEKKLNNLSHGNI